MAVLNLSNHQLLGEPNQNSKKRPDLLIVLCVLTFIGSGFSGIVNGLAFLTVDSWAGVLDEGAFEIFNGQIEMEAIEILLNVNPTFYLLQAVFYTMSFYGAIMMWNLKKAGFHIYTVAQILLLIIAKVYMPSLPFPLIPLLLSSTFVLLYARNLRYMN